VSREPEIRVVTIGSILESTPEGLFRMDRIQREYDALLSQLDPLEREIFDEIGRELDRRVLGL
jgi:hypothetical protein